MSGRGSKFQLFGNQSNEDIAASPNAELATLPQPVMLELFKRFPNLKTLLSLRVNKILKIAIDQYFKTEFLKPAAELNTILSSPDVAAIVEKENLTIRDGLIDGSYIITFLVAPQARKKLIDCDWEGKMYLRDTVFQQIISDPTISEAARNNFKYKYLYYFKHGIFMAETGKTLKLIEQRLTQDTTLTENQKIFLDSRVTLNQIARGNMTLEEAINCCGPTVIDSLSHVVRRSQLQAGLSRGITPQQMIEIEASDHLKLPFILSISEKEVEILSDLNITLARTKDITLEKFKKFVASITQDGKFFLTIMRGPYHFDYKDVANLDFNKIMVLMANAYFLETMLRSGVLFSDVVKLPDAEIKALCDMARSMILVSGSLLPALKKFNKPISIERYTLMAEQASELKKWLQEPWPVSIHDINLLDKTTLMKLCDCVRDKTAEQVQQLLIQGIPNAITFKKVAALGAAQLDTLLTNPQSPASQAILASLNPPTVESPRNVL